MRRVAKYLSIILHPVFIPTYGIIMLLSCDDILSYLPFKQMMLIVSAILICTCIIPSVYTTVLVGMGEFDNIRIPNRIQRTLPYLISFVSYTLCLMWLDHIGMSYFYLFPFIGLTETAILMLLITPFWKINAHMCAIGGLTGGVFAYSFLVGITPFVLFSAICLIGGALGWSRMLLKAHTLSQICCGWLLGFFTISASWLIPMLT